MLQFKLRMYENSILKPMQPQELWTSAQNFENRYLYYATGLQNEQIPLDMMLIYNLFGGPADIRTKDFYILSKVIYLMLYRI